MKDDTLIQTPETALALAISISYYDKQEHSAWMLKKKRTAPYIIANHMWNTALVGTDDSGVMPGFNMWMELI